jgi:hypothetical protein
MQLHGFRSAQQVIYSHAVVLSERLVATRCQAEDRFCYILVDHILRYHEGHAGTTYSTK